jgi:hypothetical protein
MKNIQVIDGAANCAYSVFAASDKNFGEIFPEGQDVEFADEFIRRVGDERAHVILSRLWRSRVEKKSVAGIHGTLFYDLAQKKQFYPNKKETDLDNSRAR